MLSLKTAKKTPNSHNRYLFYAVTVQQKDQRFTAKGVVIIYGRGVVEIQKSCALEIRKSEILHTLEDHEL